MNMTEVLARASVDEPIERMVARTPALAAHYEGSRPVIGDPYARMPAPTASVPPPSVQTEPKRSVEPPKVEWSADIKPTHDPKFVDAFERFGALLAKHFPCSSAGATVCHFAGLPAAADAFRRGFERGRAEQ